MTERTNIPITDKNRIFHTLYYNFTEDKIPLQYAFELNTLDLGEAEEKKKQIIEAITEYPKLKEVQDKLDLKFKNDVIETVQLRNQVKELKYENEDLQMKLDGDAVTFMNLQKEMLDLKEKIKHHIEVRSGETVYSVWRRELMELIE